MLNTVEYPDARRQTISENTSDDFPTVFSMEQMASVCLPLMGFNGSPFNYDERFDLDRPYKRELALKILKGFDPKRAGNNLTMMEATVAKFVKTDLRQLSDVVKTPLHDHLESISAQATQIHRSSTQVKDIIEHGAKAWLELLFMPESRTGRHVIICSSGF